MPFGLLLDLWECHKQFKGISKPKIEVFIDDVIPNGIQKTLEIEISMMFKKVFWFETKIIHNTT